MAINWRGVIKVGFVQHEASCKVGADTVELYVIPREQGDFVWGAQVVDELAMSDRNDGNTLSLGYATAPTLESAKLAAVEAWRRWARAQAEACGYVVTEPETGRK